MSKSLVILTLIGLLGVAGLPWYAIEEGFFSIGWQPYFPTDPELAPAVLQGVAYGRPWLLPLIPLVLVPMFLLERRRTDPFAARLLIASGLLGLVYMTLQGVVIGPLGVSSPAFAAILGALDARQLGMGAGAAVTALVFSLLVAHGCARRGALRGDDFVASLLFVVAGSVLLFVFFPIAALFLRAFETDSDGYSLALFFDRLFAARTFGLGFGGTPLGSLYRTLLLATLSSVGATFIGMCLALVVARTRFPGKRVLRALTVLPIITPPFVIGLALILLFGRSGVVSVLLESTLGVPASRWIFGLPGILIAQLLSFTPIAFLVLIGVVEGLSPSLEEAAMTLGASPARLFRTVTFPLMRPGLANAFLLSFIESLADFGNPLVLGGSQQVLSTQIYFEVAGAEHDVGRAAADSMVLLLLTTVAFVAQRRWLGRARYTAVTGKADAGAPAQLPVALSQLALAVSMVFCACTAILYGLVLVGGFVENFGRNHALTLAHYREMFAWSVDRGETGTHLALTGGAWSSLFTTIVVAFVSTPVTAALGILTAWLIGRQRFVGRSAFEAMTTFSFAVPGTVVGVSYVLAFNDPPIELTGTGLLLVVCFAFRNMPVGLRAGLAALEQIDASLEEASSTLRASAARTLSRVVLPLAKPATVAALVYGFVRAMTAVSAVIFLVSADADLATTYILGRVENGGYGPAIAYSSVLIVLMVAAMASISRLVGRRELGRRAVLG